MTLPNASVRWQPVRGGKSRRDCSASQIPQARLNLISHPSPEHSHAETRWTRLLRNRTEWPPERMAARLAALEQDMSTLAALLETAWQAARAGESPAGWDGMRWTELHHRLRGWEGQASALREALGCEPR